MKGLNLDTTGFLTFCIYWPDDGLLRPKQAANNRQIINSFARRSTYFVVFYNKIWRSPITDQHLYTTLCILDHELIIEPTGFGVHCHHFKGAPFNCMFSETYRKIRSTFWPQVTWSQFLLHRIHNKCFYSKTDLKIFNNVPYYDAETWAVFNHFY